MPQAVVGHEGGGLRKPTAYAAVILVSAIVRKRFDMTVQANAGTVTNGRAVDNARRSCMHPTASRSRRPGLPGTIVVTALPPSHPCSTDVQVHVLAARDARALLRSSTLLAWREQGRPGAGRRPWSACNKKHAAEPQAQPRTPGLPCASGLRLASRSPRCTGLFGHRHPHEAKLRCEFDTSVGVSGPHDFTVRAGRRSSSAAFTSIAARLHVRDDAYAPSTRRDGATIIYFPKKRKTFF